MFFVNKDYGYDFARFLRIFIQRLLYIDVVFYYSDTDYGTMNPGRKVT